MATIFDHSNYKEYLSFSLSRGGRTKLATHLRCRPSHLSQVLRGQADLSVEHGLQACRYLGLVGEESHYFMLLLQSSRAGSPDLKNYYLSQAEEVVSRRNQIHHRISESEELTNEELITYYSSWHFAAIHILISLPTIHSADQISERLQIPAGRVHDCLKFLEEAKIIRSTSNGFETCGRRIHLKSSSPMIAAHHTNWRTRTLMELGKKTADQLHFSAVYSVSRSDLVKIREKILEMIGESEKVIRTSPPETLMSLCFDLYEV